MLMGEHRLGLVSLTPTFTTSPTRESLYQLLSQTSPENMHRNVAQYRLDPATRYPNLNLRAVSPNQVRPPGTPATLPRSGLPSSPALGSPSPTG